MKGFFDKKKFVEIPQDIIIPANINLVGQGYQSIGNPINGGLSSTGSPANYGQSVVALIQARINDSTISLPTSEEVDLTDIEADIVTIQDDILALDERIDDLESADVTFATSGSQGLTIVGTSGNVTGVDSVSGGYTAIGQELFTRTVSTIHLDSTAEATISLSQASFSPYTPVQTIWNVNLRQGTTRVAYTIVSNTNSAVLTFTPANTTDYTLEVMAQSKLS